MWYELLQHLVKTSSEVLVSLYTNRNVCMSLVVQPAWRDGSMICQQKDNQVVNISLVVQPSWFLNSTSPMQARSGLKMSSSALNKCSQAALTGKGVFSSMKSCCSLGQVSRDDSLTHGAARYCYFRSSKNV